MAEKQKGLVAGNTKRRRSYEGQLEAGNAMFAERRNREPYRKQPIGQR